MAIYHLSATIVQRSKGHSAVAGAAYRSGTRLQDRATGEVHDYGRKRGIVQSEIIAPNHAPQWVYDREELWNRVEFVEKRRDSQPAREIRLGLPHELTDEQRAELVFDYARDMFASRGMVADISIHRADRHGDQRNHHAHIMLTMRELDGDQFAARKQRDWNREEVLEEWREQWEVYQNRALEEAGADARVDHRTLEAQGIDREPTHHLGKEATAIEREGKHSRIGDENREIAERNHELDELVSELAALDAEIAEELAKEHLPIETETTPEIEISSPAVEEPPSQSWSEQKEAAQSAFASRITASFEQEIEQQGEVREYGLGKNWFDRTLTMFENFYYDTIEQVKDFWRKYVGNRSREDRDDPDRGDRR